MTNVKEDKQIFGAILLTKSDTGENFDFWRLSRDFDEVMEADNDKVILADNVEDVMQQLYSRYLCDPECTWIQASTENFKAIAEKTDHCGRRRRLYHRTYGDDSVKGWKVLPHIKVTEPESRDQLQLLSQAHGYLLLEDCHFYELGGERVFREDGFVTAQQCDHIRVRWNPVNAIRQEHRKKVREIEDRLAPKLPQEILNKLGECVNPNNWPASHPWCHEVYGPKGEHTGWNNYKEYNYNANEILRYITLTRKLWPKDHSWRYSYHIGSALEAAVQHVHGLRASTDQWNQKLARWITREARVAKVEIPRKPQLPKKPNKKRRRTCSQKIKSPPPVPTSELLCAA
jgi:hypothetical protein